MQSNQKVIPYKKRFRPRAATLILLIIILYIVVIAWNYMSQEHISIYEVNETSIADDSTLTGMILRSEIVCGAEDKGYVNFYHADQSKVGKNEVIYTIDSTGAVGDILNTMDSENLTTIEDISKIREVINVFYSNYNPSAYYDINDFHYNIENTVFEQSRDNLYGDLKKQLSKADLESDFIRSKAKEAGIISYSIDGFENTRLEGITEEMFQNTSSVERKQLHSSEHVEKDTPVYKLVTSEDWQIVLPVSEELYEKIKDLKTIRVTVKKDDISFNAGLTFQNNGSMTLAVLSVGRFMGRYLNDRFIDIELKLNAASGFKIPNSSIMTKEMVLVPGQLVTPGGDKSENGIIRLTYNQDGGTDKEFTSLENCTLEEGKYYVSHALLKPGDMVVNPSNNEPVAMVETAAVDGVYCVNAGYCQFKRIEKIYENNEYTIISPDTRGGISNFDHIVVNPDRIDEDDFVE